MGQKVKENLLSGTQMANQKIERICDPPLLYTK